MSEGTLWALLGATAGFVGVTELIRWYRRRGKPCEYPNHHYYTDLDCPRCGGRAE